MHKSGEIVNFTLQEIRNTTTNNCSKLVNTIGMIVKLNLNKTCSVVSICHKYEYKIRIKTKKSKVNLENKEKPGNTLLKNDDPTYLHFFTYDQLKKSAELINGENRGILHGTVELCKCPPKIKCPGCSGTGICATCNGDKQVDCSVCHGDKKCVACNGSGIYTCTNCNGDGECPECNDGWVTCDDCYGDGTMTCPDCNGTGNFIDESCDKCGGTGYYGYTNKKCHACGGTGRFVRECRRCDGSGTVDCESCDGEGGWDCEECHGTGKCSHCHGDGGFTCKACRGSGTCGKCQGKGKIWCPDCQGKGVCFECKGEKTVVCPRCNGLGEYQTFTEYTLADCNSQKELLSFNVDQNDISIINGDRVYNGVIYDFFAGKANIYDDKSIIQSVTSDKVALVNEWIALEQFFPISKNHVGNDYLNVTAELFKIPVTIIELNCNRSNFPIYIIGNEKIVFYEKLPSWIGQLVGRLAKIFIIT